MTAVSAKSLRVLIVEDEALVAMALEDMVALAGYQAVGYADDLPSAAAAVGKGHPDVALVDINLGAGGSGIDVAVALRAAGLPVLFVSGNRPDARGRAAAVGTLAKPVTDAVLARALEVVAALRAGAPPPPLPPGMELH